VVLSGLAVGLVGSMAVGVPQARSAAAAPAAACVGAQPDAWSAGLMAALCRRSVEDLSARTVSSQTSVRPDGSRTLVSFAQPRWVRQADTSWTEVDTGLRLSGGAVVPGATVLPVTFSLGVPAAGRTRRRVPQHQETRA